MLDKNAVFFSVTALELRRVGKNIRNKDDKMNSLLSKVNILQCSVQNVIVLNDCEVNCMYIQV